jgi:hypothetical protein
MNSSESQQPRGRDHALQAVISRATVDRAFRQQLLGDPTRAIRDSLGIAIPSNYRIRFVERDPTVDALIVLPDLKADDGELSDSDLESIAGGANTDGSWAAGGPPSGQAQTW